MPPPVVPSNSPAVSLPPVTRSSSHSDFLTDIPDSSLLNNPTYHQPVAAPAFDYSGFPHGMTTMPPTETKPGWDVLSGLPGPAAGPSAQYPPRTPTARQMAPHQPKRMMTPKSNVTSSSHIHPPVSTSPVCLSVCLCVCVSVCVSDVFKVKPNM